MKNKGLVFLLLLGGCTSSISKNSNDWTLHQFDLGSARLEFALPHESGPVARTKSNVDLRTDVEFNEWDSFPLLNSLIDYEEKFSVGVLGALNVTVAVRRCPEFGASLEECVKGRTAADLPIYKQKFGANYSLPKVTFASVIIDGKPALQAIASDGSEKKIYFELAGRNFVVISFKLIDNSSGARIIWKKRANGDVQKAVKSIRFQVFRQP